MGHFNLKLLWIPFGQLLEILATFNFIIWTHWRKGYPTNESTQILSIIVQRLCDGDLLLDEVRVHEHW